MTTVRRSMGFVVLVVSGLVASSARPALAAPGDLDTAFGGDGKVTTNFTSGFDGAAGMAIQTDGKIVAAGGTGRGGGRFALARYNPNGTLDTTFGGDGRVTTNVTSGEDRAGGVAIQTDGKIVAAGGADGWFALVRYKANGSLDSTFGGDGKVTTNFTADFDEAHAVAIQADGKAVATGEASGRFALARYRTNGTLDTTFGGDGKVTTRFKGFSPAFGVAIQATDGRIVAAGTQNFGRFAVARYNPNGTLDTIFSGNGKTTTNFSARQDAAFGVAVRVNGKIVAAGSAGGGEGLDVFDSTFALARYNPDGTRDTAFDGDGRVTTNFSPGEDGASGVAIQGNGKIVAAGGAGGRGGRFALARYNTDGSLATTFGGDGKVTTNFTAGDDGAEAVAIQADGKIVAAGHARSGGGSGSGSGSFALARYVSV
jgi:uncharacterized delta-60 repeat protein